MYQMLCTYKKRLLIALVVTVIVLQIAFKLDLPGESLASSEKAVDKSFKGFLANSKIHEPSFFLEKQCEKLMQPNPPEILVKKAIRKSRHEFNYFESEGAVIRSCYSYLSDRIDPIVLTPVNDEEASFPVAYGLLVYKNFNQAEQLFRAIYRPQNYYCFHIDKSADEKFVAQMRSLIDCFPGHVVAVADPVDVVWGQHSVLMAEILCMRALLELSNKWWYYINLTGEEFPLVTNLELVTVLKSLKGVNILDGVRTQVMTDRLPETLPFNLHKYKSSTHVLLNYRAVDYIVNNRTVSATLLKLLEPMRSSCESFFALLQFNPELNFPGGLKIHPEEVVMKDPLLPRYKLWTFKPGQCISGRVQREICMLGVKHLPELTSKAYGRKIAANKFPWTFEPMAWDCMQIWHHSKVRKEYETGIIAMNTSHFWDNDYVKNARTVEGF